MQRVQQPRDRGERLPGGLRVPGHAGERGQLGEEERGTGVTGREIRRHRREPPVALAEQFEPDPVGAAVAPVGEGDELVAHRPRGGQQLLGLRGAGRAPRPAARRRPVCRFGRGADHRGPDDPFLVQAVHGVHRAHLRLDPVQPGGVVGAGVGGWRDRTPGAAPQLRTARQGGEHRHVAAPQLRDLLVLHAGPAGSAQERGAQQ